MYIYLESRWPLETIVFGLSYEIFIAHIRYLIARINVWSSSFAMVPTYNVYYIRYSSDDAHNSEHTIIVLISGRFIDAERWQYQA